MHKPTDVQYSRRIGVTTRKASISNCRGLAGVAVFLTIETLAKRVCRGWFWLNQAIAGKKLVGCCNSVICSLVVVLISSRAEDLCLGKKVTWQLVALIEDHKCMEVAKHEWYIYAVHRPWLLFCGHFFGTCNSIASQLF